MPDREHFLRAVGYKSLLLPRRLFITRMLRPVLFLLFLVLIGRFQNADRFVLSDGMG